MFRLTARDEAAVTVSEESGRLTLGRYPTPVEHLRGLSVSGSELWVKRDDLTHDGYGGNKVRKLEFVLAAARQRGARRVVTMGGAGSHHVLATTYFGTRAGLQVEAVLVPQPRTAHVVEVLRASLGQGLTPFPVASWGAVPFALALRVASGAHVIPVGGSSVAGSMGYVRAGAELAEQVRQGVLPEPDVCVVALGSGGTAAGLAAAFAVAGMRTRVVGVCVSGPPWALRVLSLRLARACARRAGLRGAAASPGAMARRLTLDTRFLGAGYGHAVSYGDEATSAALSLAGLDLDATYTAKAFAAALWHVRSLRSRRVLYWHTLSSAPMQALLECAPAEDRLSGPLRRLIGSVGRVV